MEFRPFGFQFIHEFDPVFRLACFTGKFQNYKGVERGIYIKLLAPMQTAQQQFMFTRTDNLPQLNPHSFRAVYNHIVLRSHLPPETGTAEVSPFPDSLRCHFAEHIAVIIQIDRH